MPDQKRLAYPENSESYRLFTNAKQTAKTKLPDTDEILLQSGIINNANGSAYVEYNDAKGKNRAFLR